MQNIEYIYSNFIRGKKIITDSRKIEGGEVFIALKGDKFNGNKYAVSALDKGAAIAIIDEEQDLVDDRFIRVDDCLTFLQDIANLHRNKLKIPIIAITGTNGKTTTKELCHKVLSKKFNVSSTDGNLNNHIGVPLTLLKMDANTQIGVVEMGSSSLGEIELLCNIANPDVGIITNIGEAHLETFININNIRQEKTSLFRYIKDNNGSLIVNAEDSFLIEASQGINRTTFGHKEGDIRGHIIENEQQLSVEVSDLNIVIKSKLFGKYNFENIMAAIAIGYKLGINSNCIEDAINNYSPDNLRSQIINIGDNTIILDAYNANPTSMKTCIKEYATSNYSNKHIIVGDMLELGENSYVYHKEIVELIKTLKFKNVYLIGELFYSQKGRFGEFIYFKDTQEAYTYISENKIKEATILIKGSRANKLEDIVKYL